MVRFGYWFHLVLIECGEATVLEKVSFHNQVRRKNFKDPSITEKEYMIIDDAAHEKALQKEKPEEEKTKVVKEYM